MVDFGFDQVSPEEKRRRVRAVFDRVSGRYDWMNHLMSLGMHRLWKRVAVWHGQVRENQTVVDIAAGTGDLTLLLSKQGGPRGYGWAIEVSRSMLELGRDKLIDQGHVANIRWIQADAEHLPLTDQSVDTVLIGFGLRNITDQQQALASIYRILKPGGKLVVLEFSRPMLPVLEDWYRYYLFHWLPQLGKWVAQDEASYRYLAESIDRHPDQITLKHLIQQAGFSCQYYDIGLGVVAVHKAYKY